MAVPLLVAYWTVTVRGVRKLNETSTLTAEVLSETVAGLIEIVGFPSSSVIVITPVASAIVAPLLTFDRPILNVSVPSGRLSASTLTDTVFEVSPGLKIITPPAVVKSLPAVAVPFEVLQFKVIVEADAPLIVTVVVIAAAFSFEVEASATLIAGAPSSSVIVTVA